MALSEKFRQQTAGGTNSGTKTLQPQLPAPNFRLQNSIHRHPLLTYTAHLNTSCLTCGLLPSLEIEDGFHHERRQWHQIDLR